MSFVDCISSKRLQLSKFSYVIFLGMSLYICRSYIACLFIIFKQCLHHCCLIFVMLWSHNIMKLYNTFIMYQIILNTNSYILSQNASRILIKMIIYRTPTFLYTPKSCLLNLKLLYSIITPLMVFQTSKSYIIYALIYSLYIFSHNLQLNTRNPLLSRWYPITVD